MLKAVAFSIKLIHLYLWFKHIYLYITWLLLLHKCQHINLNIINTIYWTLLNTSWLFYLRSNSLLTTVITVTLGNSLLATITNVNCYSCHSSSLLSPLTTLSLSLLSLLVNYHSWLLSLSTTVITVTLGNSLLATMTIDNCHYCYSRLVWLLAISAVLFLSFFIVKKMFSSDLSPAHGTSRWYDKKVC